MTTNQEIDVRHLAQSWVHRCVENGVPLGDYQAITNSITDWDGWCSAWRRTAETRLGDAEAADARGAEMTAAELRLVATIELHFGKFLFVHDMDQLRDAHRLAVESYRLAIPRLPWPGSVVRVPYEGGHLEGIFRAPTTGEQRHPTVVVVPGLDATKEEMHRFQEVFLRRGMATFCFDGPGQGEAEYDHVLKADWEHVSSAALDVLCRREDVDTDRLAMVGVSLGGYFAGRAAAVEPRLRASASVGGCFSFGECWDRLAPLTRRAFVVRSGASDDQEGRALAESFTLAGVQDSVGSPFLVVHGAQDRLFGEDQAQSMYRHFEKSGELVIEPDGNHVLHNLAYRVRPAVADWTAARLGLA